MRCRLRRKSGDCERTGCEVALLLLLLSMMTMTTATMTIMMRRVSMLLMKVRPMKKTRKKR